MFYLFTYIAKNLSYKEDLNKSASSNNTFTLVLKKLGDKLHYFKVVPCIHSNTMKHLHFTTRIREALWDESRVICLHVPLLHEFSIKLT